MPIKKSSSKKAIKENTEEFAKSRIRKGVSPKKAYKQGYAVAMKSAGKSKKK